MVILNSARVNATNIQNQSFANLYNLLNNRTNIPLPVGLPVNHKFVYVRLPNIGRGFIGFPFIVISRTMPTKGGTNADLTKSFMSYDFSVRVFSQDSSSDNIGNPTGAEQCNLITDDIIQTLNSSVNRKTLIGQRMANLEYNIETDEDDFNGRTVFISEFDLRFESTLLLTT